MRILLFFLIITGLCASCIAQQHLFSAANGKWGIRDNDRTVIPAIYDTVFGFDPTGKVCLACHKRVTSSGSSFIKVKSTSYRCNYLDASNRRLVIRNDEGDTTSIFSLGRHAVSQYSHTGNVMAVSAKGVRNLVTKDFRQLTFKGYYNVEAVDGADFFRCERQSESEAVYCGIMTKEERQLVPFLYSSIAVNPADSLIIGCTAGFKGNDDVYDFYGRKVAGSTRHIAEATRKVLVEKNPGEPGKYFVVNRATGKVTETDADELVLRSGEVVLRKKKTWYRLNPATGEKEILKNQ